MITNMNGYKVFTIGDKNVGIFPEEFYIIGKFCFENRNEKYKFEKELLKAFEIILDNPQIQRR